MSVQKDQGHGTDLAHVGATMVVEERPNWDANWLIEKRWGDWTGDDIDAGRAPEPYEVLPVKGNGLLNTGITMMWGRIIGGFDAHFPAYSSGNAYTVVGSGTAGFSAAHTDLQGTNTFESAMDSGYPVISAQTVTFRSTFSTALANFNWEEIGVKNGAGAVSSTVKLMNRKVQSLGTKVGTATWTVTLTITLS